MYTVKETAGLMSLSEHTIRYYTDKGLVPGLKRDANNIRLFDEESLNWLRMVKCLRDCGMSIEAIREYCDLCLEGDATIEARYRIILAQKEVAAAQLAEAQKRVEYLQHKEQNYLDTMSGKKPDTMNPDKWPTKSVG